jgi:hypothetical protein
MTPDKRARLVLFKTRRIKNYAKSWWQVREQVIPPLRKCHAVPLHPMSSTHLEAQCYARYALRVPTAQIKQTRLLHVLKALTAQVGSHRAPHALQ